MHGLFSYRSSPSSDGYVLNTWNCEKLLFLVYDNFSIRLAVEIDLIFSHLPPPSAQNNSNFLRLLAFRQSIEKEAEKRIQPYMSKLQFWQKVFALNQWVYIILRESSLDSWCNRSSILNSLFWAIFPCLAASALWHYNLWRRLSAMAATGYES